jgi:hypothetical protein
MPKHTQSTINRVLNAVKANPGLHARTYAVKIGISAATVSSVIQIHAPELLKTGFLAVHPNEILQPDWYHALSPRDKKMVPLTGYEGKPILFDFDGESLDPSLQKLLKAKADLYIILTRCYDLPLFRRMKTMEYMARIDQKLIAEWVLDVPVAPKGRGRRWIPSHRRGAAL